MVKFNGLVGGLLILIFSFSPSPLRASDLRPFSFISQITGFPEDLIFRIACMESELNPLAIGISISRKTWKTISEKLPLVRKKMIAKKGKVLIALYPESVEEALKAVSILEELGINYDIGLMQINRANVKRWGIAPYLLFDPRLNLLAAGIILNDCLRRYRTFEDVLACYNCGRAKCLAGQKYARKILFDF